MNILQTEDTICAIATAQGGAIGTIRVSGPEAITLTDRIFKPVSGKPLAERAPYTLTFGHILTPEGEIIDEVLVSLFRAPHSYTGQDSTEISCHGSSYILQQVMQLLIRQGCRAAGPGEYTQRAFLNGKMDLSQAEAVADLIASTSAATHRMAMADSAVNWLSCVTSCSTSPPSWNWNSTSATTRNWSLPTVRNWKTSPVRLSWLSITW